MELETLMPTNNIVCSDKNQPSLYAWVCKLSS